MLVLCSHLVGFEIMGVLVIETTSVFVFPFLTPLPLPPLWFGFCVRRTQRKGS